MVSPALDLLVKESEGIINKIIKDMLPKIGKAIDQKVVQFDQFVAAATPYTFDVPLFGQNAELNLTMPTSPKIGNDLIEVFFDGLFDNADASAKVFNHSAVEYPVRFQHSHSNQFWVHETTFNSLLMRMQD
jgi:hypothetical protein